MSGCRLSTAYDGLTAAVHTLGHSASHLEMSDTHIHDACISTGKLVLLLEHTKVMYGDGVILVLIVANQVAQYNSMRRVGP